MHSRTPFFRDRSQLLRRRAGGWYLLALLVVAPWLGMLHSVVHPVVPAGVSASLHHVVGHGAVSGAAQGHAADSHGLARLFGPHDAGDCRVYDQLLQADALLSMPPAVVPVFWAAVRFAVPPQPSPSCGSAVFEARAPPPVR
ncbi:hypothetical protein [Xylophilus ampelinus]|uniref:DUF2946 family protein n=1 Tax=Xylophilus ampelinus TaxID=54067 RepID=A0A318SI69_9BURK|nr:hypothetical protein [Xylophilus ampelinus]MCS4508678.1 hypothetical protein [Xylophilus ampelinus]PYE74307.1 hypothetical protein DFQ15_12626 [Xylophilus ampelinus]